MKKSTMLAVAVLISTYSFTGAMAMGLGKNSPEMNAITSAFKTATQKSITPTLNSNDITMGYTGEDVAKNLVTGTRIIM